MDKKNNKDIELLNRLINGGNILASDVHNCDIKCNVCSKNGNCRYQTPTALKNTK